MNKKINWSEDSTDSGTSTENMKDVWLEWLPVGRIGRVEFLKRMSFAGGILAFLLYMSQGHFSPLSIFLIVLLAAVILNQCIKRWHDRNKSAWSMLWCLAPFLLGGFVPSFSQESMGVISGIMVLILLAELTFGKGTNGENRFDTFEPVSRSQPEVAPKNWTGV